MTLVWVGPEQFEPLSPFAARFRYNRVAGSSDWSRYDDEELAPITLTNDRLLSSRAEIERVLTVTASKREITVSKMRTEFGATNEHNIKVGNWAGVSG